MKAIKLLIKIMELGLVITFITSCTASSTPLPATTSPTSTRLPATTSPTSTPTPRATSSPTPGATSSPGGAILEILTQPTLTAEPLKTREVITPENAARLSQLDYRGRGMISSITWSPDGAQIAVASSTGIYLVDGTSYTEKPFSSSSSKCVVFSPDGSIIASAEGFSVKLREAATGKGLNTLDGHTDMVYSISFSPDGKWLSSGSRDGTMILWDVSTGKALQTVQGGGTFLYQVAFSADSKTLASVAHEKHIVLWDFSDGSQLRPLSTYSGIMMAFSPSSESLVTADYTISEMGVNTDYTVQVWDISSHQQRSALTGHSYAGGPLAFSLDGKLLATGSTDSTIKLWDTSTYTERLTLTGHDEPVSSISFSPDSTRLASATMRTIKIWDVASGQELRTLRGPNAAISEEGLGGFNGYGGYTPNVAFSPDGNILAAGIESGPVKLYDSSTGELLGELAAPANRIVRIVFSPDSKLLAVAYDQFVPTEIIGVQIWDVATQTSLLVIDDFVLFDGFTGAVGGLAFSPDGSLLATSGGNPWGAPGFVRVWDVADGKLVLDMGFIDLWMDTSSCNDHCYGTTYNIAFNPDGSILAGVNDDGRVHLFDMQKQREISVFQGVGAYGNGIAFSPDGELLAVSGSANNSDGSGDLRVWELSTGELLQKLDGHSQDVGFVAFSADGLVLASSSLDGSVRLWEVETGNSLAVLDVPLAADIAFSPDGTLLATAGDVLRLWGVPGE